MTKSCLTSSQSCWPYSSFGLSTVSSYYRAWVLVCDSNKLRSSVCWLHFSWVYTQSKLAKYSLDFVFCNDRARIQNSFSPHSSAVRHRLILTVCISDSYRCGGCFHTPVGLLCIFWKMSILKGFLLVHSSVVLFMLFKYLSYLYLINLNSLLDVWPTDILSVGHLCSVSSVAQ